MVPSLTPAKTKCTPVSSCIMEYSRHTEERLAVAALELHIADVTGVFHASKEQNFLQTSPLWSMPTSMINTPSSDHANSKACV